VPVVLCILTNLYAVFSVTTKSYLYPICKSSENWWYLAASAGAFGVIVKKQTPAHDPK
jgi:hypothetical protein